ncbi:MAG: protein translocase subunit SecF, partial [Mailhella sp.]|nr:protein translocase subunit SecF [Mailhella sp.]
MAFAILSRQTNINFAGFRRIAYVISSLFILVGLFAIIMNGGLRYGVDFAGGAMVQVQFEKPIADEQVKGALQALNLPGLTVQQVGTEDRDYMLRFSM